MAEMSAYASAFTPLDSSDGDDAIAERVANARALVASRLTSSDMWCYMYRVLAELANDLIAKTASLSPGCRTVYIAMRRDCKVEASC